MVVVASLFCVGSSSFTNASPPTPPVSFAPTTTARATSKKLLSTRVNVPVQVLPEASERRTFQSPLGPHDGMVRESRAVAPVPTSEVLTNVPLGLNHSMRWHFPLPPAIFP